MAEDPSMSTAIARLSDKIDSLARLVDERLKNTDDRTERDRRATAQTITSLTEVVHSLANTVERTYVRKDNYNLAHQSLEDRVKENEQDIKEAKDRQTWVMRALVNTILSPFVVGIVFLVIA